MIGIKIRKIGYSLDDFSLWILILVCLSGLVVWVAAEFILTYISAMFLAVVLHQLMKNSQISYIYKLSIFTFVTIGMFQRVFFLVLDPSEYSFDMTTPLTDAILAGTLAYVALILIIFLCLVRGQQYFFKKRTISSSVNYMQLPTSTKLLTVVMIYYVISFFITSYLGIYYNVGMQGGESSSLGYWIHLFDFEQASSILVMLYIYCSRSLSRNFQYSVLLLILIFVLYTVFRGSRGALFSFVFMIWYANAVFNPSFLIQRKHIVLTLSILFGIGVPLFFVAFAFRYMHLQQYDFDPLSLMQGASFFNMLAPISDRLGEVDILSAVLFQLQLRDYAEYVSFLGTLDLTIKGLLPSFIYQQTIMSIEQVFPYVFRGIPLDVVHGEHWTGPGIFIAYFNIYLAPFFMAIFMFVSMKLGEKIQYLIKDPYMRFLIVTNFAYLFYAGSISTGAFSLIVSVFIRFLVILYILWIASRLTNSTLFTQKTRISMNEKNLGPSSLLH